MSKVKNIIKWSVYTILTIIIGGGTFLQLSSDYNIYLVSSQSMKPTINIGDIIVSSPVDSLLNKGLRPGTIITFEHGKELIAHRIVSIEGESLTTKGDAVKDPDPWLTSPAEVQGIYLFKIPHVGKLLNSVQAKLMGTSWAYFNNDESNASEGLVSGIRALNLNSGNAAINRRIEYRLDASRVVSMNVAFWFRPHNIEAGDLVFQVYNGNTYETLFDLADYPTAQNDTWCFFDEELTNTEYFTSDFRLRLYGAALAVDNMDLRLGDVMLTMKRNPQQYSGGGELLAEMKASTINWKSFHPSL